MGGSWSPVQQHPTERSPFITDQALASSSQSGVVIPARRSFDVAMAKLTTSGPGLTDLVVTSYLLAATNYAVNHLPLWLDRGLRHAINSIAGVVGSATFLLWCAIAGYAFWRYRKAAWPVLLGAPFALATFVGVLLYVVAVTFDHYR